MTEQVKLNQRQDQALQLIEKLKGYMVTNNKTQHNISVEMDLQMATLNRWLRGKSLPSRAWCEVIETFLKDRGVE